MFTKKKEVEQKKTFIPESVHGFLASAGLADFSEKLINRGATKVHQLGDTTLTEEDLQAVGMNVDQIEKLRRACKEKGTP